MARHCQLVTDTRSSVDGLGPRLAPNICNDLTEFCAENFLNAKTGGRCKVWIAISRSLSHLDVDPTSDASGSWTGPHN